MSGALEQLLRQRDAAVPAPTQATTSGRSLRPAVSLIAVLAALTLGGGAVTPGFLAGDNLRLILLSTAITGVVAVAMTPITMSGNFVSLASSQTAMLGAVLFAGLVAAGWHYLVAALVVLAALALLGALEGLVVSIGLNTLITTLAVGAIVYGAVSERTHGDDVVFTGRTPGWLRNGQLLGLPTAIYVMLAVTVVVTALVHLTVRGRWTVLVGANTATARLSGVPVRAVIVASFVVAAVGAGLAGIVAASQVGTANVQFLPTLTVDAIAAILIGGTSVAGGHGSPLRTAVGALVIAMLNNLLSRHGLAAGPAQAVLGALVLLVVVSLRLLETREER